MKRPGRLECGLCEAGGLGVRSIHVALGVWPFEGQRTRAEREQIWPEEAEKISRADNGPGQACVFHGWCWTGPETLRWELLLLNGAGGQRESTWPRGEPVG